MIGAERHMQQYLQQHTIQWVVDSAAFNPLTQTVK